MRYCLVLFCCLLFDSLIHAQNNTFAVSGTVVDNNSLPLPNATVLFLAKKDSVILKSSVTSKSGLFIIDKVKPGAYLISISHTGFQLFYGTVNVSAGDVKLDNFILQPATKQLSGVTVTGRKPFIEIQDDKTVINVESSVVSAGGTAMDVLERSPGITTNQDGAISLRGKEGVIIMIDGRPSPLSASDIAVMLRNMPANAVDKIEIITNPSAKYDAAGNAGIINIRLKKDLRMGINGNYTLGYGQGVYPKLNGGINFNYRNKKINLFGNHNSSYRKNFRDLTFERFFLDNNGILETYLRQETYTVFDPVNHASRLGLDYYVSKKTIIGVLADANFNTTTPLGNSTTFLKDGTGNTIFSVSSGEETEDKRWNLNLNVNLKHNFDSSGKELSVDADFAKYSAEANSNYPLLQQTGGPVQGFAVSPFLSVQDRTFEVYSIKADYRRPFSKKIFFEAGIKKSAVKNANDVIFYNTNGGVNNFDSSRSNNFIYTENINAAYLNLRKTFTKWTIQAGLRVEQTIGDGEQKATGEKFKRNYTQLFPSFTATHAVSKSDKIIFSYSRRIGRPAFNQLNPFRFYTDPFAYNTGNPLLNPMLTHSFEFTYNLNNKLITTVSYGKTNNFIIGFFRKEEGSKIQEEKQFNFDNRDNYSISFTAPLKPAKWWSSNNSMVLFRNIFGGDYLGTVISNNKNTVSINSTNTFSLPKGLTIEFSGNFRSKIAWGPNLINNFGGVSFGIAKSIIQGKASIRFNVSDIFYTQVLNLEATNQNPKVNLINAGDSRAGNIVFTYRFGKKTVAQNRNRTTGTEEERNRIN